MQIISYHESNTLLEGETHFLGMRVEHALADSEGLACSGDVDEASTYLSRVYNSNRLQLADGGETFRMRLQTSSVGRLGLARLSFGAEVDIEQAGDRPFVLLTTQMRGTSSVTAAGETATGGRGFVVIDSAGQPVSKHFSADSERCNVRIEQSVIDAKCAQLLDRRLDRPLRFSPFASNNGVVGRHWIGLLQMLLGYVGTPFPGAADPIVHNLEEAVLLHLLLEHEHTYSEALRNGGRRVAPRHVKRAEEFIRANARKALTLERIAEAAGCSIRTLSDAFLQSSGTTPMNFLRNIRLEGVRAELNREPTVGAITDIALAWGFNHLGRFSADYRLRFGESPSETRRRHR